MTHNAPLISIIIPVYNIGKYLRRCLDSVVNQTYKNIEIICIDDGSTDNSGSICDEYAEKDARVKVIHKVNGGVSAARNSGLELMRGVYFTFVDGDDYLRNNCIEYMYATMTANKSDLIQIEFVTGHDDAFPDIKSKEALLLYDKYKALSGFKTHSTAWGKLYKAEIHSHIRFPVGLINEDEATYYQYVYSSNLICISNQRCYYYYQSSNSIMRNNRISMDFVQIYNDRLRYFEEKDDYLYKKTCERYALVLILSYGSFLRKKAFKEQLDVLQSEYKKIYDIAITSADIKYKLPIYMFNVLPDITAKIIGVIKRK